MTFNNDTLLMAAISRVENESLKPFASALAAAGHRRLNEAIFSCSDWWQQLSSLLREWPCDMVLMRRPDVAQLVRMPAVGFAPGF